VASKSGLSLVRVKRRITVLPGSTGSPTNSLVSVRPETRRSSVAGLPVVASPSTVAVTAPVVLVWNPGGASIGTCRVTEKAQVSPGARVPPVKLKVEASGTPASWEPAPQMSFRGSPIAARPDSAASRSSVKLIAVASPGASSSWVRVSSSVTRPPGSTGSSVNSLNRVGGATTSSVSEAGGPVRVAPSTVAVISLVVLVYVPAGAPGSICRVTVKLHEAPGPRLPELRSSETEPMMGKLFTWVRVPPQAAMGRPTEVVPARKTLTSSKKVMSVAPKLVLLLVIVSSTSTVAPLATVESWNVLVRTGNTSTTRVSPAGAPATVSPPAVPLTLLVVLGKLPGAALAGTCKVTWKVQVSPGSRVPLVRVSRLVPERLEPGPHGAMGSGGTAWRPMRTASRSSVKVIPLAVSLRSRLVIENSSVVVPPGNAGSSTKDLTRASSSATTVSEALALPLLPPPKKVRSLVRLSRRPMAVAVTSTPMVQLSLARMNPSIKETVFPPAGAVGLPLQPFERLGGPAISSPTGRLSPKDKLETREPIAVLSMVKVRRLVAPSWTMAGLKLLEKPGRSSAMVSVAVAGPLLPAVDVKSPETFWCDPRVLPVTSTVIWQLEKAPTAPSVSVIVVPPSGAVRVPPQVFERKAGAAMVSAAGRVSVNARSVSGCGLSEVIVNVSVLTLPEPMVPGLKVFEKETGLWT